MAEVIMCPGPYWITVYKTLIPHCNWGSATPSAHDWPTPPSPQQTQKSHFSCLGQAAAGTLFSWTEHLIQQFSSRFTACIDCLATQSLHYLAAALTPPPPPSYPWSGGKIQQLISWSEPWCSAGGKGYQTAGILARLTRLCTFRLSVKTQLCLLSFHIPKQRRQ